MYKYHQVSQSLEAYGLLVAGNDSPSSSSPGLGFALLQAHSAHGRLGLLLGADRCSVQEKKRDKQNP